MTPIWVRSLPIWVRSARKIQASGLLALDAIETHISARLTIWDIEKVSKMNILYRFLKDLPLFEMEIWRNLNFGRLL